MNTQNSNPGFNPVFNSGPNPCMQNTQPALQNNQPYNPPAPNCAPPIVQKMQRVFNTKETVFAWICYALAYLFCLSIPINSNPFGALIVIVLMFVSTFIVMLVNGKKPKIMPTLVGISALTVSACLVLTANGFLHFFAFSYSLIAYCYFLYGLSSDNRFRFSDMIVADFIKAIFVLPFVSFSAMFRAIFSGKNSKSGNLVLRILVGIAIAIVPTVAVLLLLSYDSSFTKLLDKVFSFEFADILNHIVCLGFGLLVGAYAYSIFISASDNKCTNALTAQSCKVKLVNIRIAPAVTVLTAVLPVLFVYVVFFISQWQYYISGFTGVLPKEFSYAEYAREGFFQLCTVSVINLVILILISLFLKRKQDKKSVTLIALSIVISVFTLVLISTALAKMYMYIDCYGLTPKRVYATWFMAVLAVVFILVILKQFISKLKLVAISLAVLIVMFSALALSGVDSLIAKYNVDRYVDGTLKTVDIDAMSDLGDAAIPQLVRLANILEEKNNIDITEYDITEYEDSMYYDLAVLLQYRIEEIEDEEYIEEHDIWSFTIPSINAQNALMSIVEESSSMS